MSVDTSESVSPTPSETDPPPEPDPGGGAGTLQTRIAALLPFARDDAGRYILSAVLAVLATLCQLGPFYVIYLAVRGVVDGTAGADDFYGYAWAALALVVGQYLFLGLSTSISHRAAFGTLFRLRMRIGERLGRVPLGRVTGKRSGEIQRTLSQDIERLELFLAHAIPDLVAAVVVVLASTVWMLVVDWRMALAAAVCVVAAIALMSRGVARSQPLMGGYMASMGRMNGSIVEMVRGLPIVRTFNRTGETFAETQEAIHAAAKYQADWGRAFLPLFTAFYTVAAATVVTIVPVGLLLWSNDAIDTPELLFFFVIGLGYGTPVVKLLDFSANMSHLTYGVQLINELKDAGELPEADREAELRDSSVEFDDVSFRYDGAERDALSGVSFHAEPGTVTALVGPSGAGKSTVARLICRFFDVDAGSIRVGGTDVRQIPFSQLMRHVSFVFQETFLFDDTVAANLRLARPDATDEELEKACRSARAHEFIAAMPDGYQTRIGQHGARLSGGERQRLAIARTLLKDTEVVVLDEATAFVDPENEVALQDAVDALVADRTVIIVAHRLSTIVGAEQILVVDDGRIVERGHHGELVAADGLYATMWQAFQAAEQVALGDAVHQERP
ncbi:ABC transporter ATP-binding protein [Phytoactinopolyspora halotolerans]|uniref:ABC transporter ATP-binding protein n=1 Tax=Phytoactinopolyspora halotolerans TaxID=1981512 RepID=A0A6L9SDN9_9ACTN|nr:ABC transporter ATP-binding protein [Phytoactinopolyspora halotolerans]NEE02724.1 ABC transporter ATP-binding protein [Phytoactinopolyspora halotolerans]